MNWRVFDLLLVMTCAFLAGMALTDGRNLTVVWMLLVGISAGSRLVKS